MILYFLLFFIYLFHLFLEQNNKMFPNLCYCKKCLEMDKERTECAKLLKWCNGCNGCLWFIGKEYEKHVMDELKLNADEFAMHRREIDISAKHTNRDYYWERKPFKTSIVRKVQNRKKQPPKRLNKRTHFIPPNKNVVIRNSTHKMNALTKDVVGDQWNFCRIRCEKAVIDRWTKAGKTMSPEMKSGLLVRDITLIVVDKEDLPLVSMLFNESCDII